MKLVSVAPALPLEGPVPDPLVLLADVWPWCRQGLDQIIGDAGLELTQEDVYAMVRQGVAFLFLIRDDAGEDLGFTILQRHIEIDGSATLLVWFMWCPPGALWRVQGEVHEHLAQLARGIRCKRMRMHSNRSANAWQRRGWEPKQTVFERGV